MSLRNLSTEKGLIAYVLDDEKSWQRHYEYWLSKLSIKSYNFSSIKDLNSFMDDSQERPCMAFIDMSLSPKINGHNLDGLTTIEPLRKKFPECKIILSTGYPHDAKNYVERVDLILEKRDKILKKSLTQSVFRERIISSFPDFFENCHYEN